MALQTALTRHSRPGANSQPRDARPAIRGMCKDPDRADSHSRDKPAVAVFSQSLKKISAWSPSKDRRLAQKKYHVEIEAPFVLSNASFHGFGSMLSELVNWFRVNGLLLLGFILSFDTAFLFGYLVLSDFPFLQLVDFTLISSISSQAMLFMFFAAPALLFIFRLSLIEGNTPITRIFKARPSQIGLLLLIILLWSLFIFAQDLRPGFVGFVAAIALVFFLYHPTNTSSIGSTDFCRYVRLLRINPKRTWRLAVKPYYVLMFQNCAWLFGMILFAWIGFLRFSYMSNDNIQLLEIEGRSVETAVVGRNSIGLIGRNVGGEYVVYPLEGISSIALPKQ